jgi:uncharacterized protein (UPF0332 family)
MSKALHREHLDVAKATKANLDQYKRGVYLESVTGVSIEELKVRACLARFALAKRFLSYAREGQSHDPKNCRLVVSRAYYAMYHAARAVVYFSHGGDDHESHSELPNYLPGDFPNQVVWRNALRDARLERNRADYDPYPMTDRAYSKTAKSVFADGGRFVREARRYLNCNSYDLI